MSEQCQPAVAERACERRDVAKLMEKSAQAGVLIGEAAGQRLRIAAVTAKIERGGDIAVAGQCQREGLHQLLRAGESMGDDDHRSRFGGCEPEDCHRRRSGAFMRNGDAVARAIELPNGRENCQDRNDRYNDVSHVATLAQNRACE